MVRHTAIDVIESGSVVVQIRPGLDIGEEIRRDQLVHGHPVLPFREGLPLGFQLGTQPAPGTALPPTALAAPDALRLLTGFLARVERGIVR